MTLTCELVRDFAPIYVISKQKADICNSFYRATRMHSADYAVARCLSVRQSVCQSVTRRYSVETAKHIFKLFSPHVSHTILVFFYTKRYHNIPTESPNGGVECMGA